MLAPAKVNLYLEVVGKRPDGYHDIETLFQTVDWGDELELMTADYNVFHMPWRGPWPPGDPQQNLVLRAVTAWDAAGGGPDVRPVRVVKRLPIGGGLAGGSTDAAAVLRLLQGVSARLSPRRLHEVAASLGSDVPFLLRGGTAIGRGRGEILETLVPPPRTTLVLVMPPFGTETAKVYGAFGPRLRPPPRDGLKAAVEALASGVPARIRGAHFNDLAIPAMAAYPELRRFTAEVERRLGRPPCLSGSGSTLFDVPDAGEQEDVLDRLEGLAGSRQVVHTTGPVA
jgi:4-diphosphocytidyl-2-C-methyl-D-erythritol kinase